MTTDLSNQTLGNQEKADLEDAFFSFSMRKGTECMFTRATRALGYLEKLNPQERAYLEKVQGSIIEYFRDIAPLNKFKSQDA